MARLRKPTVLKIACGTERADRKNPDEPMAKIYDGGPPSYLNKEALEVWHQYAEILKTSGILTEKDVEVFGSFCMIAAEKRKFGKKRIKKEDLRLFGDLVTRTAVGCVIGNDPSGQQQAGGSKEERWRGKRP